MDPAGDPVFLLEAHWCRLNQISSYTDSWTCLTGADEFFLEILPDFRSVLGLLDLYDMEEVVEDIRWAANEKMSLAVSRFASPAASAAEPARSSPSLASFLEPPSDWLEPEEEADQGVLDQVTYILPYSTIGVVSVFHGVFGRSSSWFSSLPSWVPGLHSSVLPEPDQTCMSACPPRTYFCLGGQTCLLTTAFPSLDLRFNSSPSVRSSSSLRGSSSCLCSSTPPSR